MRLFTALWPSGEAVAALVSALEHASPAHPGGAWRPVPPETWHVTLCFHGEDDPEARAAALDTAFAGARAPRLRLTGLGTFPGTLWAGVQDEGGLTGLAARAGADPASYRAHVTLARRPRSARDRPELAPGADVEPGPWWSPGEVLLVRSEPGLRYAPVHRIPLHP